MELPQDQLDELKSIASNIALCDEGGITFILLPDFRLPEGCNPGVVNLLLCPALRDGYQSRLYFSQQVQPPTGRPPLNWNGAARIAEQNWHAFSWRTVSGLRLAQMLLTHLKALQ